MHELSIAQSIVEMVDEAASGAGWSKVTTITLRIGALSSVVEDALRFSFDLVAAGTAAEGATLTVEILPIVIFCAECREERTLVTANFCCPSCGSSSADIRQGREFELTSVEVE